MSQQFKKNKKLSEIDVAYFQEAPKGAIMRRYVLHKLISVAPQPLPEYYLSIYLSIVIYW